MHIHVNQIINFFADAPLHFIEAFPLTKRFPYDTTTFYTSPDSNCLIFTTLGSAYASIDGERVKLEARHVLHTTSKLKIKVEQCEDSYWNYIVINYRVPLEDQSSFSLYKQNYILSIGNNDLISQYLQVLITSHECTSSLSKLQIKSNFYQLIEYLLIALQEQTRSSKAEVMLEAVEYIHDRFNKPISVTQVSEIFGIERRRFAYLFERYTGMTPNHYLTSFRMKRSKELLRTQHYTIAEIAELVGYQDSFYFSRVFKKCNGLSPSEYRKKIQY